MGIIKKSQIKESGEIFLEKGPINLIPAAVVEEDRELSDEGREQEAQSIIKLAKAEANRIREEARRQGEDAGRREARGENESKLKEALDTLNQAVKARKKIMKDAETEILRLALKSAEQIIRSEVSLHRDVCLNIVAEAINRVSDREQVIVRVNRDDAEYIKRYKDRLAGIVDGIRSFSVIEDNQVEPGGCVIETNLGYIDARISTKLEAIEEAFKKISESENET